MKRVPFFENPMLRVQFPMWRGKLVLILIGLAFLALALRALYLQGMTTEFLQQQGERRFERTLTLPASCQTCTRLGAKPWVAWQSVQQSSRQTGMAGISVLTTAVASMSGKSRTVRTDR